MTEVINVKILHLVLKKKWYEMQERGEKTEEYRELTEYWRKRLIDQETLRLKPYTHVCFHYGYTKRCFIHKIDSITAGMGLPEWGAPTYREVFIIKHHKELAPRATPCAWLPAEQANNMIIRSSLRESRRWAVQELLRQKTEPTMRNLDGFYSRIKEQENK